MEIIPGMMSDLRILPPLTDVDPKESEPVHDEDTGMFYLK